jgi:hypothetical protein
MLRSGGPDVRVDPGCPPTRWTPGAPGTRPDAGMEAGTFPEVGERRDAGATPAAIADRLPGIVGAGGILPAGDARVEGMGWPVVGHTRTHAS